MPRKTSKPKLATLYTKIDAAAYDKLVKLANAEHRSIAAQVSLILTAYINKRVP